MSSASPARTLRRPWPQLPLPPSAVEAGAARSAVARATRTAEHRQFRDSADVMSGRHRGSPSLLARSTHDQNYVKRFPNLQV